MQTDDSTPDGNHEPSKSPSPPNGGEEHRFTVTFFRDKYAKSRSTKATTLAALRDRILSTDATTKEALPWLKLASFGNRRTKDGSLRNNDNVEAVTGIEIDYDAKRVAFDDAVEKLAATQLMSLVYTSPSNAKAAPKWRVLCPTSRDLPPSDRARLVARVNGVLGGIAAPESFTLSQSYFFGSVNGNPDHRAQIVDGDFVDLRDDLDAAAVGSGPSLADANPFAAYGSQHSFGANGHAPPVDVEARLAAMKYKGEDNTCIHLTQLSVTASLLSAGEKLDAVVARVLEATRKAVGDEVAATWDWDEEAKTVEGLCEDWLRKHPEQTYRREDHVAKNVEIGDDDGEPVVPQIMTLDDMHRDLVFVSNSGYSAVANRKTLRVYRKAVAADHYAASTVEVQRSRGAPRKAPVLDLWIASRHRPTVDCVAWVPGSPQICKSPESAEVAFNTWRGIAPMAAPDDWRQRAQPFLDHVAYLVPVDSERRRFLQWLAHIVQQPEVLPHTCWLMITPTTGIGRNLMVSIIVRVLRGHVAAGVSLPDMLKGSFNGRISQKLLATVDEIREGSASQRYERQETIKRLVTEEHRHINHKYGLQVVEKNCCRWIFLSNHYDALPFDNSDRRIEVVENPTERKPPEYYAKLFALLDDADFVGSVRRFLETHDISDFKAGAHATMNSAKERAIISMMTEIDRAVADFKEEWPTELTTRTKIAEAIPGDYNDAHLTHAIARVGMRGTGKRIRIDGHKHSVVIVRGAWTPDAVKAASEEAIIRVIKGHPLLDT